MSEKTFNLSTEHSTIESNHFKNWNSSNLKAFKIKIKSLLINQFFKPFYLTFFKLMVLLLSLNIFKLKNGHIIIIYSLELAFKSGLGFTNEPDNSLADL